LITPADIPKRRERKSGGLIIVDNEPAIYAGRMINCIGNKKAGAQPAFFRDAED
jgi:hypothetical protein